MQVMGNTFGQLFRVTTFGESHGGSVGVVIDGCPPNIHISNIDIQRELDRRRPGQSKIATQRKEEDRCEILAGVFADKTLGTPIAILVRNKDARPEDYIETPIDTEDFGAVVFRMGNGARGAFTASQVSAGRKNGLSIRRTDLRDHCENQSLHCENEGR